jgi:hypothetical protein
MEGFGVEGVMDRGAIDDMIVLILTTVVACTCTTVVGATESAVDTIVRT